METILTETGFGLSDKSKLGTAEVLLGVMVDTQSMTLRFDPIQCKGVKQTLLLLRTERLKSRPHISPPYLRKIKLVQ